MGISYLHWGNFLIYSARVNIQEICHVHCIREPWSILDDPWYFWTPQQHLYWSSGFLPRSFRSWRTTKPGLTCLCKRQAHNRRMKHCQLVPALAERRRQSPSIHWPPGGSRQLPSKALGRDQRGAPRKLSPLGFLQNIVQHITVTPHSWASGRYNQSPIIMPLPPFWTNSEPIFPANLFKDFCQY